MFITLYCHTVVCVSVNAVFYLYCTVFPSSFITCVLSGVALRWRGNNLTPDYRDTINYYWKRWRNQPHCADDRQNCSG